MNLQGVLAIFAVFFIGLALLVPRGWSRRIGIMCIICSLAAASFFYVRDRRISSRYEKISVGDPQTRVLALLGSPRQKTDCSTGYGGYKRGDLERKETPPDCAEEFWYYSFYFPQSFTCSFNNDKKVIRKYVLTSP